MLELQNVSFSVDIDGKEKKIINDISLSIPDGKLIVVTGPNGQARSDRGEHDALYRYDKKGFKAFI